MGIQLADGGCLSSSRSKCPIYTHYSTGCAQREQALWTRLDRQMVLSPFDNPPAAVQSGPVRDWQLAGFAAWQKQNPFSVSMVLTNRNCSWSRLVPKVNCCSEERHKLEEIMYPGKPRRELVAGSTVRIAPAAAAARRMTWKGGTYSLRWDAKHQTDHTFDASETQRRAFPTICLISFQAVWYSLPPKV